VRLEVQINGTALAPGAAIDPAVLATAGLARVAAWRCLWRRLDRRFRHWEAADPHITAFDGQVELYPCKHGFLDPDRRWGTGCLVTVQDTRIATVELRVIEGVYAASNLYDRFVDAATARLGEPGTVGRRRRQWSLAAGQLVAELDRSRLNATFRLLAANGDGDSGEEPASGQARHTSA
jgi:hypothetical protein